MRFLDSQVAIGTAILLLSDPSQASHSHFGALERRNSHHYHKKAHTSPRVKGLGETAQDLKKRGSCTFPTNVGLVPVTPSSLNAGWAQAPDMPCKPGSYCPYACPSGQLMAQWDPTSTSYKYPESQYGGLYCDQNGNIQKPFPNKPYCYNGFGNVMVVNNCGAVHAVCQTVLPGYEDMLIPTRVDSTAVIAVPGTDYWASTAAHFYHNSPGVSTTDGCVWGDSSKPIGNWAPYVSGANMDGSGNTFLKLGWNPEYLDAFGSTLPNWGLKITCSGGNCNGLPCSIDPAVNKVNEVTSGQSATGAGGGNYCVATIPMGATASIVVFNAGDSNSSGASPSSSTSSPTPTQTSSHTATPSSSSSSLTSSSSSLSSKSSSSSSASGSVSTTSLLSTSNAPHLLFENYTSTENANSASMTSSTSAPSSTGAVTTALTVNASKNVASRTMLSGTLGFSALLAVAVTCLL